MTQQVVITGYGGVTALANDIDDSWQRLKDNQSGIAPMTRWDVSEWQYPLGAELKNFEPRKMVPDRKMLKLISRHDVTGLKAAAMAIEHSQLLDYRASLKDNSRFNDRTGVYVGSPGNKFSQQYDFMPLLTKSKGNMSAFAKQLFDEVHPMWLLKILPNNVLGHTGILYGFKGANQNITNHIVSGMQAIIEASNAIKAGQIDRAVVIAYDIGFEPQSLLYYAGLGVISATGLNSFDQNRDGTIMGEGAAAILLESKEAALERSATIYGEVLSGASTCEAKGVFPIREDGDGVARAMTLALDNAKLSADDIGMICAHANGNRLSDSSEVKAIKRIFKGLNPPVTGFKWSVGHTLCAAGVIESLFSLLAMRENSVPGIATLETQADDCQGIAVSQTAQAPTSPIAMIVTRGFASLTSCLLIKAH